MKILFSHGAGAPSSSPWMLGSAARLATLGEVVTFDYLARVQSQSRMLSQMIAPYDNSTQTRWDRAEFTVQLKSGGEVWTMGGSD